MEEINASEKGYEWVKDPKGYFLIRIDLKKKVIEVGFIEGTGKKPVQENIKYKIVGKDPKIIRRQIFKMGLISRIDHALSIGEELQKAKVALDLGIKYVQDDLLNYNIKN
ncbi:hypothetical protein COV11_02630 [Candidatus Woesearchaeota archaeon CG10_big_fil_rev_8_21_14_0_10_30_7]|nr:MAG: hypothetical protein COV11_02630 [Candidatus Woesearchaeota archaeon CG10_big_fil_rev_8_21_14_0_10_30_7]